MQKTVLILVNHEIVIYNFRKELVQRLLSEGYKVIISSPGGKKIESLIEMGCEHSDVIMDRHGVNPINELKLIKYYNDLIREKKPNIVLTYTIKPNIYGALICRIYKIPCIANITGLGTAVDNNGIMSKFTLFLYRIAFKNIYTIFFQNKQNMRLFKKEKISVKSHELLPGSGVNLNQFSLLPYPNDDTIEFVFISRIMKEKGIDQYLEAAERITRKHSKVKFHICGFLEDDYYERITKAEKDGFINYHGLVDDIREVLSYTHCTVHPTYYPEGLSNVLLESAASGRPIVSTDRSGTREVIDNQINGFFVESKNSNDLVRILEHFLNLTNEERETMGLQGRAKIEKEFNREIVVEEYMMKIREALEVY